MNITITGVPGSGKTTVAKMLAARLKYDFVSAGDMRGMMALERGMTIDDFNKLGLSESWTDTDVDNKIADLGKSRNNLVIEGRLAWHFVPKAYKVFLTVDPRVGAERILKDPRADERNYTSVEDAMKAVADRIASDQARYKKIYGILYDQGQSDLRLDTTNLTPEQAVDQIIAGTQRKGL